MTRVLIVGASLAGLRAAEQLRAKGFDGPITIAGAEGRMPYNRPPLSKDVLVQDDAEDAAFTSVAFRLRPSLADVEWKLASRAVSTDLSRNVVSFSDGTELGFDGLVVATGLRPRRLAIEGGEDARIVLRTFDEALTLRRRLAHGGKVVIVGAGFIGCEVAASALKRGCKVTVVEPLQVPMQRALGTMLGSALQAAHEAEGVEFRTGRAVAAILAAAEPCGGAGVVLDNGETIDADLVIESVGSQPNTEWLAGNGLDCSDGVLCDGAMRVEGRADLVAAGDVARFPNRLFDEEPRRVEHWCMPGFTARRAADSLMRHFAGLDPDAKAFSPMPAFWSDQHGLRIQSYGNPALGEDCELMEGTLDPVGLHQRGAAVGYRRGRRLIGVALVALPNESLGRYRELVAQAA